jgi:hypothetical protein
MDCATLVLSLNGVIQELNWINIIKIINKIFGGKYMKCEFCRHENEKGVKFCGKCGAQLPDVPESSTENKVDIKETAGSVVSMVKALPLKKLLTFIIPAVVVIIALIIIIPMLIPSNIAISKDNISIFNVQDMVVISGNNNSKFTIDGRLHSSQKNLNGSKAVVLTDYSYSSGGTLWFVTTSGSTRIADEVFSYQIADSGNGVAYFAERDNNNDTSSLYLYDTSSRRTTLITYEAFGGMVAISPNGKSVAYISDYDRSNNEFTGYIRIDGKSAERLGNNMMAIAISDGGKHIYYTRMSEDGWSASLHVRSGRNDNRLIPEISSWGWSSIILNRDYSQVIFNIDDRAFFSRNGSERERVAGSSIYGLLLPRGGQSVSYSSGGPNIMVYGVRTFANTLAVTNNGIEIIANNFEANRVTSSNSNAFISDDGKSLLFISGSTLVRIDPNKKDAERNEIARDVRTFTASNNGRTVFYVNRDDELWCVKGNGRPSRVANFVSSDYLTMSNNSNKIFFLVDRTRSGGELHYSNNGGRNVRITTDVTEVWNTPANVFYRTIDSDLFRSNGNERFTLFQGD